MANIIPQILNCYIQLNLTPFKNKIVGFFPSKGIIASKITAHAADIAKKSHMPEILPTKWPLQAAPLIGRNNGNVPLTLKPQRLYATAVHPNTRIPVQCAVKSVFKMNFFGVAFVNIAIT